ncbi:hypothetical protein E4L96_20390 [Massilia arenosa]|uniref:Surface-adhesin protein E-like domain-containing protein n=1 Tax=Zemynaea arenosa TaxID=2561931 RepID=A0A4Y9RZR5_9BURK|nr:surface-adhesin E family protein [Massilia arenosa]TFW13235.1 hypothetical protein E4L96_20390 [Massilia arenosa]
MNRPVLAALALPALLALPGLAQAAQWSKLPAPPGASAAIDRSSIVRSGASYKAWTLEAPAAQHMTPDGKPYRAVKALNLYSCEDRTATLLMQVFYADAKGLGEAVQTIRFEKFTPDEVVPDSVNDGAMQVVCKVAKDDAAKAEAAAAAAAPKKK